MLTATCIVQPKDRKRAKGFVLVSDLSETIHQLPIANSVLVM